MTETSLTRSLSRHARFTSTKRSALVAASVKVFKIFLLDSTIAWNSHPRKGGRLTKLQHRLHLLVVPA